MGNIIVLSVLAIVLLPMIIGHGIPLFLLVIVGLVVFFAIASG